jgi:hypothetical protein
LEKKIGEYTLKSAKSSELPTRGKWRNLASEFIDALDQVPERHLKIEDIKTQKEYDSIYDALKHIVRTNKLNIQVQREIVDGKFIIFLLKDLRYFVK